MTWQFLSLSWIEFVEIRVIHGCNWEYAECGCIGMCGMCGRHR
jgi:hypothetical protein